MAVAVIAVAVVAVRFGTTAAGPATVHLYVLLRERARTGVLAMFVQRGSRVLAAAVAALRGEAQVRPTLAVATHPV